MKLLVALLLLLVILQVTFSRKHHKKRRHKKASPVYYCRDESDGSEYPPGNNFRRSSDNYLCNCTVSRTDEGYFNSRLECIAPVETKTNYNVQRVDPEFCLYNEVRYELNSKWKMQVDGVSYDCECNDKGKLRCSYQSQKTLVKQSHNEETAVYGDPADRNCRSGLYAEGEEFAVRDASGFYSICRCAHRSAECRVVTTSGAECRFPFEVDGVFYSTCTYLEESQDPVCAINSWGADSAKFAQCITTLNGLQKYFGYVFTTGGNSNGAKCHFPFVYNGDTYHECTSVGRNSTWCSTTGNYDKDRRYGYCPNDSETLKQVNIIGSTVVLDCPYETTDEIAPKLTWYTVVNGERTKIYEYDFATQFGAPTDTAGSFAGRIYMPNSRQLEIKDFKETDRKQFECEISDRRRTQYVEETSEVLKPGPNNLSIIYFPTLDKTLFSWENPNDAYEYVRLEIQKIGEDKYQLAKLVNGESELTMYSLEQDVEYQIRLFCVTDEEETQKIIATFTLPRVKYIRKTAIINGEIVELPFAQEEPSLATIILNWDSSSVSKDLIIGWLVVVEDLSSGTRREIPVDIDEESLTITDVLPGASYRITLYAQQNPQSRVQVISKVLTTEYTGTFEIVSEPLVLLSSDSTVKISWPAAPSATEYEILYSIGESTRWRRLRKVPATKEPKINVKGLRPGIVYNLKIVPLKEGEEGGFKIVSFDLNDLYNKNTNKENSSPLSPPQNFRVIDLDRDTATLTWTAPEDTRFLQYKVVVEKYPANENNEKITRLTNRLEYPAYGLEPDQSYIFTVSTIANGIESEPVSEIVTTLNKVCHVNQEWKEDNEKFYQTSPQGFMQNCTCSKTPTGSKVQCSPMFCNVDGESYFVGQSWNRLNQKELFYDLCSCIHRNGSDYPVGSTEIRCIYQKPYIPHYGPDRVSENFVEKVLRCPFPEEISLPVVKWYKVQDDGSKKHIYTFYGDQAGGTEEEEVGDLSGRVNMPNRNDLHINPVRPTDSGTFECHVTYHGSTSVEYPVTINIIPTIKKPSVYITRRPIINHDTTGTATINWSVSSENVTKYIVQYENVDVPNEKKTIVVYSPNVEINDLIPSATYSVTIIPVIGNAHGSVTNFVISTDENGIVLEESGEPDEDNSNIVQEKVDEAETTSTPSIKRVSEVQIPAKTATSFTVDWSQTDSDLIPVGTTYKVEWRPSDSEENPISVYVNETKYTIADLIPNTSYDIFIESINDQKPSDVITFEVKTNEISSINVDVSDIKPNVGDQATLYCSFEQLSNKNPHIYWSRTVSEGQEKERIAHYSPDERVEVEEKFKGKFDLAQNGKVLLINPVEEGDAGVYACSVEYNDVLEETNDARLIINGPPKPVIITSPILSEKETEYSLTWSLVEGSPTVDQFELTVQKLGPNNVPGPEFKSQSPSSVREFKLASLQPGATYVGTIVSINTAGKSEPTNFEFTTNHSGQPDMPTGASIEKLDSNGLTVVLNEPPNDRFENYRIMITNLKHLSRPTKIYDVPYSERNFVIEDLLPDTLYNLAIVIVNLDMESSPITTNFTTPKKPIPSPTGIQLLDSDYGQTRFLIDAPESNDVVFYKATYRLFGTPKSEGIVVTTSEGSNELDLPLKSGEVYEIDIVAVGNNITSQTITFKITVPKVVPVLNDIISSSSTTTINWDLPNNRIVEKYVIILLNENDEVVRREEVYPNNENVTQKHTFEDLQPDTNYTIKFKEVFETDESAWKTLNIKTGKIIQPIPKPASPTNLEVTQTKANSIHLTWNTPEDDIIYYVIEYVGEDNVVKTTNIEREESGRFPEGVNFEGISPGKTHTFRLIAVSEEGESLPVVYRVTTEEVEFKPEAPHITGVEPSETEIVVHWEGLNEHVTKYKVAVLNEDQEVVKEIHLEKQPDGSFPNQARIDYLEPNTEYQVILSKLYDSGDETRQTMNIRTLEEMDTVTVRTTTAAVDYEQLSYEVKIIPTDQSATLYFHMLGETPAELFVVKYKEEDDIEFQMIKNGKGYSGFVTLENLKPGTKYNVYVTVLARNFPGQRWISYDFETQLHDTIEEEEDKVEKNTQSSNSESKYFTTTPRVSVSIKTTTPKTKSTTVSGLNENKGQEPVPSEMSPNTKSNNVPVVTSPKLTTISTIVEDNGVTQQKIPNGNKKEDVSFKIFNENENIIVTVPDEDKKKFENVKVYIKPTDSLENPKVTTIPKDEIEEAITIEIDEPRETVYDVKVEFLDINDKVVSEEEKVITVVNIETTTKVATVATEIGSTEKIVIKPEISVENNNIVSIKIPNSDDTVIVKLLEADSGKNLDSVEVIGDEIIEFTLPENDLDHEIELEVIDSNGIKSNKKYPVVIHTSETSEPKPTESSMKIILDEADIEFLDNSIRIPNDVLDFIYKISISVRTFGDERFKLYEVYKEDIKNEMKIPNLKPSYTYKVNLVMVAYDGSISRRQKTVVYNRPSLDSMSFEITSNNNDIKIDFTDVDEDQIEKVYVKLQSKTDETSQDTVVYGEDLPNGILLSDINPDNYDITISVEDIYGDVVDKKTSITVKDNTASSSTVQPTTTTTTAATTTVTTRKRPAKLPAPTIAEMTPSENKVVVHLDETTPEFQSFIVRVANQDGNILQVEDHSTDKPLVVKNLSPDTDYRIEITGVDANGVRSTPKLVGVRTTSPEEVAFVPVIKKIIPNQQDAVIHLTLPATVKQAVVRIKEDETVKQTHVLDDTNDISINELVPETEYTVEVDIVLNDGTIDFEEATFKTLPIETLKKPIVTIDTEEDSVTINFSRPSDEMTYYLIEVQSDHDELPKRYVVNKEDFTVENQQIVVNDLTPDSTYIVKVQGFGEIGNTIPTITTIKTKPLSEQTKTYKYLITNVEHEQEKFTIYWDSNVTEPTSITLFLYNNELETLKEIEVDADASKISVENLEPSSEYTTYLVITNNHGTYTSDEYTFYTPSQSMIPAPKPPLKFVELSPTSDSVFASWEGSSENVKSYVVLYQQVGQPWHPKLIKVHGENGLAPFRRVRIEGLFPDIKYQIAVKSSGVGGDSTWLTTYFNTRPENEEPTPPTPLKRVEEILFDFVTSNRASFTISDDQHLDFYEVLWGSQNERPVKQRVEPGSRVVLEALSPQTRYFINVVGVKENRQTPTLETSFITPQVVVDSRVQDVRNFNQLTGKNTAEFSWEVPNSNVFKQIVLEYREDNGNTEFEKIIMRPEYEEYTLNYLTPDTNYRGRLNFIPKSTQTEVLVHDFTFKTLDTGSSEVELAPTTEKNPLNNNRDLVTSKATEKNSPTTTKQTTISSTREVVKTTTKLVTTTETINLVSKVGYINIPKAPLYNEISWVPSDEVDTYIISYTPSQDGYETTKVVQVDGDEISAVLPDLIPGLEYRIKIVSVLDEIESIPATATFIARMPGPVDLKFTPTADHKVRIKWKHPVKEVTHTQVDYKLSSNEHFTTKVLPKEVTSLLIPFKNKDDKLILKMMSRGRLRDGRVVESLTNEYSVYLRLSDTSIDDHLVRVVDVTDTDAYVLVSSEDITGGWVVTVYDESNEIYESPMNYPGHSTRGYLPGLKPASTYTTVVRNALTGDEIGRVRFMTKVSKAKNVAIRNDADGSVMLTWDKPDESINGYILKYRPTKSRKTKTEDISSSKNFHVFTDLSPNTEYQVELLPTYEDVISHQFTTPGTPVIIRFTTSNYEEVYEAIEPTPSPSQLRPPYNVQVESRGSTKSVIRWAPSPDKIDLYNVKILKRSSNELVSEVNVPRTDKSVFINSLQPDTDYIVQIYSNRGEENSKVQQALFHTDAENSNINTTPVETNFENGATTHSTAATIKWDELNGLDYQKFRVVAEPIDNTNKKPLLWTLNSETKSFRLNELDSGVKYRVYVEGYVAGNWIKVVKDQIITTDLETPGNFRAIKSSLKSIVVAWDAPNDAITGYKLEYYEEGSNEVIEYLPAPSQNDDRLEIANLKPGRRYRLKLYAVNHDVVSEPTTLYMDTHVPRPKKFNAIQATPNILAMTWLKPHKDVTHYTLRVLGPGGREIINNMQLSASTTSYRIENLHPDTRYRIYLTSWIGDVASQPSYKSRHTSAHVSSVSGESTSTKEGYLVSWKGKSRTVDGWKVVVTPQDGSEGWEESLDRFTKQIELNNLKGDVEYVVKIFPFSGSLLGVPSTVRIPASASSSDTRSHISSINEGIHSTVEDWELNVSEVTSTSMIVNWPTPETISQLESYSLIYKIASDDDQTYQSVTPQPSLSDSFAKITGLHPGTLYTIKMIALLSNGRSTELELSVSTPILPPKNVKLQKSDSFYMLIWEKPTADITGYTLKYKKVSDDQSYEVIKLEPDQTFYEFKSLDAGESYEIILFARNGESNSQSQVFKFVPENFSTDCVDRTTNTRYQLGQSWMATVNNFLMNCTCSEPRRQYCTNQNTCQDTNGHLYKPGDKWSSTNEAGLKQICECIENIGYKCFVKNCYESGVYHNNGDSWTSSDLNTSCTCECPEDELLGCVTKCKKHTVV